VQGVRVQAEYSNGKKTVVPFWAGKDLEWQIVDGTQ
jgi:dihydroorotase